MAVKIRLKRMGKIRAPFYRVVVMDSRTKRDGRAIEEIGKYHPTEEPSVIQIDSERVQYWLGQGAQPTEAVAALLKVTGDWQKHIGEPGAEGTLKVKEQGKSKKELYEAAVAAAGGAKEESTPAPAPRKKATKKAPEQMAPEQPKTEQPKADEAKATEEADTEADTEADDKAEVKAEVKAGAAAVPEASSEAKAPESTDEA